MEAINQSIIFPLEMFIIGGTNFWVLGVILLFLYASTVHSASKSPLSLSNRLIDALSNRYYNTHCKAHGYSHFVETFNVSIFAGLLVDLL